MPVEVLSRDGARLVWRNTLAPGEATPWHTDPFQRHTVIVAGAEITLEFDDGGRLLVPVQPGDAGWDAPDSRRHRAVNASDQTYTEVVMFFLDQPGADPQPEAP